MLKKLLTGLLGVGLLFPLSSFSQEKCTTVHMEALRKAANPSMESDLDFEHWMAREITRMNADPSRKSGVVKTIPTVVHVIYSNGTENISDDMVFSQIDILNEDFRRTNPDTTNTPVAFRPVAVDTEIEFCLAQTDPDGNPTNGINRVSLSGSPFSTGYINSTIKPSTQWDPDLYFNIWVCNISGGTLGYAQFPSSSGLSGMPGSGGSASTDGIVVTYTSVGRPPFNTFGGPYNLGRTATHEVGHWLGLRHIWGDGGCSMDDFCGDTPESDASNYGCNQSHSSCGTTDMVQNYMDYTDDDCMNLFTADQKSRMDVVLSLSPQRASLLTSPVCSPPTSPPAASFSADNIEGCPGEAIQFTDESAFAPTSWNWSFPGGSPSSSTLENPIVTYPTAGTFDVTLIVTNPYGNDTVTYTSYITIGAGATTTWFEEDFESGSFATNGWTVVNPDGLNTWEFASVSGSTPGSNAARMHIFTNRNSGARDYLESQTFDFNVHTGNTLDFEYAHRRRSSSFRDSLIIKLSTDGGLTWPNTLYANAENGSGNFATGSINNVDFVPGSSDDWCFDGSLGVTICPSIDLSAWDGQSNVKIRFETYNGQGNNIYVDNISITGSCPTPSSAPVADFSADFTSGCAPLTVSFSDLSTNSPTSWDWSFSGGVSGSTLPNPVVTFSSPGTYNVTLVATNGGGSDTVSSTSYITVFDNPDLLPLDISGDTCGTGNGSATVQATGGSPGYSFNWSTIPPQTTATATGLTSGTYTVTVTDANGCEDVDAYTVSGNAPLSSVMNSDDGTPGLDDGWASPDMSGGTSPYAYAWSDGQTTDTASGLAPGTYTVTVTDDNGCSLVDTVEISPLITGVTASDLEAGISIFPNPNSGSFTVLLPKSMDIDLNLINLLGQDILTDLPFEQQGKILNAQLPEISPGIYYLEIIGEEFRAIMKLRIEY